MCSRVCLIVNLNILDYILAKWELWITFGLGPRKYCGVNSSILASYLKSTKARFERLFAMTTQVGCKKSEYKDI